MLYATTRRFLEVFGLESLKHLPSLRELNDLADQKAAASLESEALAATGEGVDPAAGALAGAEAGDRAAPVSDAMSEAAGGTEDSVDRGLTSIGDEAGTGTGRAAAGSEREPR